MKIFYVAVGLFKLNRQETNKPYPTIVLSGKECNLDIQEMTVWTTLNWKISSYEKLEKAYKERENKFNMIYSRSLEETLERLITRGLVAEGVGETDEEALYNLISNLYVIPLHQSLSMRILSFMRLMFIHNVPFKKAKGVFEYDKKTKSEKEIMSLAFSAPLSTAEIIKCVDKNINCILNEDDVIEFLYDDFTTTSENIAETSYNLPSSIPVMNDILNLYLRRQILFEGR